MRLKRFANNHHVFKVGLLPLPGGKILQVHNLSRIESHQVGSDCINRTGLPSGQYKPHLDLILRVLPQSLHPRQRIDHHIAGLHHRIKVGDGLVQAQGVRLSFFRAGQDAFCVLQAQRNQGP